MELLDVGTLAIRRLDGGSLDNLNATSTDAMAGSHFLVELLNSAVKGDVTVLLVSIVYTGTGVVTNPDTKVLNSGGVLLEDFIDS